MRYKRMLILSAMSQWVGLWSQQERMWGRSELLSTRRRGPTTIETGYNGLGCRRVRNCEDMVGTLDQGVVVSPSVSGHSTPYVVRPCESTPKTTAGNAIVSAKIGMTGTVVLAGVALTSVWGLKEFEPDRRFRDKLPTFRQPHRHPGMVERKYIFGRKFIALVKTLNSGHASYAARTTPTSGAWFSGGDNQHGNS
ncbi:hypothetical protein B0H13DRAFT_2290912 [Mycena leptocephala]|nr:hypothetical protein B0H13DRAFT_2290912 [Mycena leptocephala]